MRILTLVSVTLLLPFISHSQNEGVNVLFLGNSYVYTNDLPVVLNELANSLGQPFSFDQNTIAGYTLQNHSTNITSMNLIALGEWDHVIMHEQSQMPAFPIADVEASVFPYAEALVDASREANECCMPIFMMTWGREEGDTENCDAWPPVCTYDGQQDLLAQRYVQMAEDNECWTAPVGEAWRYVRENTNDGIDLYAADGSHPSFAGTYLTACVLYAQMYQESPEGSTYSGSLSDDDAQYLQEVAALITLEDQDQWNYHPVVSADMEITGFTPSFTATLDLSFAADSALVTDENGTAIWYEGDNSGYFFSQSGTYYWIMDVYSDCGQGLSIDSLLIVPPSVEEQAAMPIKLYPNPVGETLFVDGADRPSRYFIRDELQRIVLEGRIDPGRTALNVGELRSGMYWIQIEGGGLHPFVKD